MTDTRPYFTLGAFAVIFDEAGRVLLSHRRDMDAWNLPGGGVETDELPTASVIREVREETGLDCAVERLVGVYGKPGTTDMIFTFQCRITGGALGLTDESDANAFFALDEIPSNTLLKHIERIHDAVRARESGCAPVFRSQASPRFASAKFNTEKPIH